MLTINDRAILSVGMPIEGREFIRYFSGFPITSLDQEVVCYHKKSFHKRNRKDVGSGMDLFLCRGNITKDHLPADFLSLCKTHGQLMVRDAAIYGMQIHVPLTGERMGTENSYLAMVQELWQLGYIVVQSLIQTKEFPLIQWSITDPTLLKMIVEEVKQIENHSETAIVQTIASVERRESIVAELVEWCEENGYKTDILDEYDIMPLRCDS